MVIITISKKFMSHYQDVLEQAKSLTQFAIIK